MRPRLLGLKDDYADDGRAISQIMTPAATPSPIKADPAGYDALSAAYKQLDAPFGEFGRDSLMVSTRAVATELARRRHLSRLGRAAGRLPGGPGRRWQRRSTRCSTTPDSGRASRSTRSSPSR